MSGKQVKRTDRQPAPHQVQPQELLPDPETPHQVQPHELLPRGPALLAKGKEIATKVMAKGSAALDKVPGAKYLRRHAAILKGHLERRYGKKAVASILSAAMCVSWGSTGAAAFGMGVPIPSAVAAAPLIVLAELWHQITGSKAVTESEEQELPPEEIERLAKELVKELEEAWKEQQSQGK